MADAEEIRRNAAEAAAFMAEGTVFTKAVKAAQVDIFSEWLVAGTAEDRERLWHTSQGLARVVLKLQQVIDAGVVQDRADEKARRRGD